MQLGNLSDDVVVKFIAYAVGRLHPGGMAAFSVGLSADEKNAMYTPINVAG